MEQKWQKRKRNLLTGCIGESNKTAHKSSQNIMFQHTTNKAELRLTSGREGRRFSQAFSHKECVCFALLTQSSAWRSSRDDKVDPPLLSTWVWQKMADSTYGWRQNEDDPLLFIMRDEGQTLGTSSLCSKDEDDCRGWSQSGRFPILCPHRW